MVNEIALSKNAQEFGEMLVQVCNAAFANNLWLEKAYERNKSEFYKFLETVSIMNCSGYDEKFIEQCIVRIDLHKIVDFNSLYKKELKKLKNRYCLFDVKHYIRNEVLLDLSKWDVDTTNYLIQHLIKVNS